VTYFKRQRGFTIVELLISVTLGLIITSALVRVYQSNTKLQTYNYALSNIQQDGRYIISALRQSLLPVGMYNEFSANLETSVDTGIEAVYIRQHPVALEADFDADPTIGSSEGTGSNPDTLVVNLMGEDTCTGSNLDFVEGSEFHVVNEYYLEDNTLRCRGHDGRYLRGLKNNGSAGQSVALLENVHNFQVHYGITQPTAGVETGFVTSWVTADRLAAFVSANGQLPVVAVKVAVLIRNDDDIFVDNVRELKLLGHESFEADDDGLYRVFESVIMFRNVWNNITAGG
jgi:type IV pilus assembly protein PilW